MLLLNIDHSEFVKSTQVEVNMVIATLNTDYTFISESECSFEEIGWSFC